MSGIGHAGMELPIPSGDIPELNPGHIFSMCCSSACLLSNMSVCYEKTKLFGAVVIDMADTFHFFERPHSVLTPNEVFHAKCPFSSPLLIRLIYQPQPCKWLKKRPS